MNYRREYDKMYKKINKLAQKGIDATFDYYLLIDEFISNGQYNLLEDVMSAKYKIDIDKFKTIDDFKKNSYDIVRLNTITNTALVLNNLFNTKNVYQIGFHFYDKTNNHYLGDIKEIENEVSLINKKYIELYIDVESMVGIPSSTSASIPQFIDDRRKPIAYNIGNHMIYNNKIYDCITSYTYSVNNLITPTYSTHWSEIYAPTYSYLMIDDNTYSLSDKYSLAIDFIKSFTYSYA